MVAILESLLALKLSCMYLALVLVFAVGSVLKRLFFCHPFIVSAFDSIAGVKFPPEIYWNTLFGTAMFGHVWRSVQLDVKKKAKLGCKAINSPVVSLEDDKCKRLLDLVQNKRPLVVNFGSCTCPIFMKRIDQYAEMVAAYKDVADFIIVYTEEAHPNDGWAFENNDDILNHKTQSERCSAARLLTPHAPCPVLVDTMLDAANMAYGAFPIRLYIIQGDHVVYQGGAGPTGYNMEEPSDWLKRYSKYEFLN